MPDSLILGETNTTTTQTRLVGNVDGAAVLWVEQQDPVNADVAIIGKGAPGRGAIVGFGGDASTGPGGHGVAGQGGAASVGSGA